jgi:hypothetical protein
MRTVAQKSKSHAPKTPKLELVTHDEDGAAADLKAAKLALDHHLADIHGALETVEEDIEAALAAVSLAQEIEEADEAELRLQCGRALAALANAHRHARLVTTYLADGTGDA